MQPPSLVSKWSTHSYEAMEPIHTCSYELVLSPLTLTLVSAGWGRGC